MIHVENLQFNTPSEKEYYRQKVSNAPCRHLQGTETVSLLVGDGYEEYIGCKKCGKLLLPDEIEEVEKTLEKFKNLSK